VVVEEEEEEEGIGKCRGGVEESTRGMVVLGLTACLGMISDIHPPPPFADCILFQGRIESDVSFCSDCNTARSH
jgi:hypothetical protein